MLVSIGGFLLQSTLPVNVTFGQQIAPVSAATVSSLMMGFAWGVGSLLAPVVGRCSATRSGWAWRCPSPRSCRCRRAVCPAAAPHGSGAAAHRSLPR